MSLESLNRAMEGTVDLSVGDIVAKYGNKQAIAMAVQKGEIPDVTKAVMAGMAIDRITASAMQPPTTTVAQDVLTPPQPAPQTGLDQIPVPEQMFNQPQGMAGGGIVAFSGGGGSRLDPRIPALMQRNPGMTFAQAARIIAGGAGLGVFSAGKMATDALMATDTGETGTPGYDYGAEQTAGGMPELQPGTTGARREPAGFMDYLRKVGLAPKEQVMDPVTGKYVDAPPKTLIETQSATPGLAGVMDREAALAEAQAKTTPLRQGETAVEDAKFARQNTGVPISSEGIGDKGITRGTGTAGTGTAKPAAKTAGPKATAGEAPKPFDPIAQLQDYERRLGISDDPDKETRDELAAAAKKLGEDKDRNANMAILKAGLAMMGGESPYAFVNIAKGGMAGLEDYGKSEGERRKEEKELMKARADLRRADEARKQNRLKEAITLEQNYLTNALNIRKTAATELQAQAAMIQARRGPAELQTYETWAAQQKAAGKPFDMESYRSSSPSVRAAEINLASKTVEALQKSFEPGGTYSSQYKAILKDKGPAAAESFKQGIILNGMATVSDYINRGGTPTTGRAGSGMPQLNIPPEIADLLKQYPTR
jgi:hypothetical protein